MIKTASTEGTFRANTRNRPGTIAEFNFNRIIGVNSSGNPATWLRVVISPKGKVITSFPY